MSDVELELITSHTRVQIADCRVKMVALRRETHGIIPGFSPEIFHQDSVIFMIRFKSQFRIVETIFW